MKNKPKSDNQVIPRRRFIQTTILSAPVLITFPTISFGKINTDDRKPDQLFWGELHTHTDLSDGNGSPENNFEIASSHLDFWTMADHAYDDIIFSRASKLKSKNPQMLNDHWGKIQDLCRSYEKPGRFIPFLGYEWTHFRYGHHNVYYLEYDQPIRMPSTLTGLYSELRNINAIVIPHHTAYPVKMTGKDWDYFDEKLSPFAEIYSLHGSSEEPGGIKPLLTGGSWMGPGESGGSIQEGLARGYKFGLIASSDSHAHHPGAYDLGLVGVFASDLTRKSLWEAFLKRRVFGVTGDRISLDFSVNGSPMGSLTKSSQKRLIDISAVAWDKIDRVEIIKNNRILHSYTEPSGNHKTERKICFRFILEWGWENIQDHEWEGELVLTEGKILKVVRCYRGSVEQCIGRGITRLSYSECKWRSRTMQIKYPIFLRYYADALAFEIECPEKAPIKISMICSGISKEFNTTAKEIMEGSRLVYFENIPPDNLSNYWGNMKIRAKYKIHQGNPKDKLTVNLKYEDNSPEHPGGHDDFYYVRLVQKNGQRAWSSPVWVSNFDQIQGTS